jgi:hypothetical protein
MTQTLQWLRESKLFATFELIFEHDVQGVKDKKYKKLPAHCFYKKNSKKLLRY